MGRMTTNLDPRHSIGIDPAGDSNIEAVGPCCLDVNTRPADFAKGRFHMVWWFIWMCVACLFFFVLMPMISNLAGGEPITAGITFGENILLLIIGWGVLIPTIVGYVHVWRTHHPMRFDRKERKVTLYHRGTTYVEPWDGITAYLYALRQTTPKGANDTEAQVRIEFRRADGSKMPVMLLGTDTYRGRYYDKAARLWEYIRVYMEEGPEALPEPDKEPERDWGWRQWVQHHSPFPLFPRKSVWSAILQPMAFPLRVLLFFLNTPTDVIYSWIARSAGAVPYPRALADACRCSETEEEKHARVTALLELYSERIRGNTREVLQLESTLLEEYRKRFVAPCYPYGEGKEEIPGDWYQARLTDLVEVNPTYNVGSGKRVVFAPIDVLAAEAPLANRDELERCMTPPSSTMFRDGDTLFPFQLPWLEDGRAAYVEFVEDMALDTDTDFGCASPDMIVLRGTKLTPEMTYCLSKDHRLREWSKGILEDGESKDKLESFSEFMVPMPKPEVLQEFQDGVAGPRLKRIIELSQENERLKRSRSRVRENTGRAEGTEQAERDLPLAGSAN